MATRYDNDVTPTQLEEPRSIATGIPLVIELDKWPTIDKLCLTSQEKLALFESRCDAIALRVSGSTLSQIQARTGIRANTLYRIIKKAHQLHPDGRIYGYRALVPWIRLSPYKRRKVVRFSPGDHQGGGAGALTTLLDEYPELHDLIQRRVFPKGANKSLTKKTLAIHIHRAFIEKCREIGLNQKNAYPFNTHRLGYASLANYITELKKNNPDKFARSNLDRSVNASLRTGDGTNRPPLALLDRVECDAHKIDAIFCILVPSPFGDIIPIIISRLWVIVLIEVASRAALGYHLSLRKECNQEDLVESIKSSLSMWEPKKIDIAGVKYQKDAGFPSSLRTEYVGACWRELSVDGAKINLSDKTNSIMNGIVGAKVKLIDRRIPNDRPFVERLFRTLETNGFHRLPSTVGSSPADIKGLNPEASAIKYFIQLEHLQQLIDILIANYNATPHSGIGGRTPLEYFDYLAKNRTEPIRRADQQLVNEIHSSRHIVTVRGSQKSGRRPYIQFCSVRYSSDFLRGKYSLVGKKITIVVNQADARVIRAFNDIGESLGPLVAAPPWNDKPHTLTIRRAVLSAIAKGKIDSNYSDPIMAYLDYLESKARKSKSASSEYLMFRKHVLDNQEALAEEVYAETQVALDKECPVQDQHEYISTTTNREQKASTSQINMPPHKMTIVGEDDDRRD